MFFSNPEIDVQIMSYLLIGVFICSVVYGFFAKEIVKALVFFSISANLVLLIFVLAGSMLFRSFGVKWIAYFSFFVWPIVNIYLITKIFSKK